MSTGRMAFPQNLRFFKLNFLILVVILIESSYSSVEVPRPRGVSLSRAGLYDPEQDFGCFDGSKKIPYNQVNDDYCDCADGSDEPGTSACPEGKFYCTNAGFKPQIITSDRVNDGICDCCDGTDEYSGNNCVNNCLEVGKAAREEAARMAELYKVGKQLRADLSEQGKKLKTEKQTRLVDLQKNRDEADKVKLEKEEIKKQAEEAESKALEYYKELEEQYRKKKQEQEAEKLREEAVETFKKYDDNQNGLIEVSEIQSRECFDKDRNGEVSEEEARTLLDNQDSVDLESFIDKAWPLMKPFIQLDSGLYKPPVTDSEVTETEEEHQEEEDDDEGDDKEQEDHDQDDEYHVEYDEETQKLVDVATEARSQFVEAERNVKDMQEQVRQIEDSLQKDFGPDEEFASLEGQCFEYKNNEYTYKLCPFEKSVQIPNSNQMETNLGRWGKWDGPTSNVYTSMLFENGQNCWNGPNRTTKVRVLCGTENKVTSVSEPNRCEYAFDFETPAACRELNADQTADIHDEL